MCSLVCNSYVPHTTNYNAHVDMEMFSVGESIDDIKYNSVR